MTTACSASIRDVIRDVEVRLRRAGGECARAEAEWLVAEALGLTRRTELYLYEAPMRPEALERIDAWVSRRAGGEPLAYVTGSTEFFGHRLHVSPAVLIPRPETEVIAQEAIARLRRLRGGGRSAPRVLDLGTGSGNIAISLAVAVPSCVVVAVELSWKALCIARANIARHGLERRVSLVQADWADGAVQQRFEVIVSNPPYVSTADVERLPESVRWEPCCALDGGADGMEGYRVLLARMPAWLSPGGSVGFECGDTHGETLSALCAQQPWAKRVDAVHDLAGRLRGLFIESV